MTCFCIVEMNSYIRLLSETFKFSYTLSPRGEFIGSIRIPDGTVLAIRVFLYPLPLGRGLG